jgi:carbonic anhydrase
MAALEAGRMSVTGDERLRETAVEALARLIAGNDRFVRGTASFAIERIPQLADAAIAQQPYATVLACSDSPVSPEMLFDAYSGELFVVQLVGNLIPSGALATLKYAAHLRTPLFVVLGHQGCAAVRAALAASHDRAPDAPVARVLDQLLPGLPTIDRKRSPDTMLDAAIEANVRWSMHQLRESLGSRSHPDPSVNVIGGVHEVTSGRVRFLP